MKRVESNLSRLLRPRTVIEVVISAPLLLWGVYTLTPLYHEHGYNDAWSNVFFIKPILVAAAAFYIMVGLVTLLGVLWGKCNLAYYGMAGTFFCYMYLTIAKLLSSGPNRAAYWIFYGALALVAAVCYLWERTDGDE